MSRAIITPAILLWARKRAAVSHAQLAQKLGVKEEHVHQWEGGIEQPTFRQAQDLARALHIPLGYLFLSTPPQTVSPIADFRTLPQTQRGHFSPELEDTLNDALRKRDWLREWRIQEGAEPLPFVGRFNIQTAPETTAEDIRQTLGIPDLPAKEVRSWNDQLHFLIRRAEEAGILILQNGVALGDNRCPLSVDEFRGFTLTDPYAPVIFINVRDSIAGRIFTLAHELVHVWSGTSGVSNPSLFDAADTYEIERFCNQAAAEMLVSSKIFPLEWQALAKQDLLDRAQHLAATFRVSVFVILIRAFEQGLIGKDALQVVYTEALDQVEPPKENSAGGGNFYNTMRVRNGRVLVQELLLALRQGSVLYREAAQLLNVRPGTLEGIMQKF